MLKQNPHSLLACLWMGGAVLSFSSMAIAARELLARLEPFEILFWRTLVMAAIVAALLPRYGLRAIRTRRPGLHLARNLLHFGGQYCWVFAIGVLPLATVFAIEFTMPVWTAVLAALLLGEKLNRGRIVMLALGIAGVLVILRPGFSLVEPGALVMLAGAAAYASTLVATKPLSAHDSPLAVLAWMSVIQTPLGLVLAAPQWVTPGAAELPWILAIGIFSFTAHYCITRSLKLGDATLVTPIDFLRLPLIAAIGAAFYAEPLDPMVLAGAAVIFAGTYYSLSRESRRAAA